MSDLKDSFVLYIGIGCGAAALLVLIILLICTSCLCYRYYNKKRSEKKVDEDIPLVVGKHNNKLAKMAIIKGGKKQRDKERKAQEMQEVGKQMLV